MAIFLSTAFALIVSRWWIESPAARMWTYLVIPVAATLILFLSSVRKSRFRRAWLLIAAGTGCWAMGDVVFFIVDGVDNYPSFADLLFLAGYPMFATGLLAITVAGRLKRELLIDLIDVTIVSLSAGVLLWPFVIEPTLAEGLTPATAVSLAYSLGDVVLLGLLAALWFNTNKRTVSVALLAVSTTLVFIADNLFYIPALTSPLVDNIAESLWLAAFAITATAALARKKDRAPQVVTGAQPLRRMIFVGFALFAIPAVILLDANSGDGLDQDDWLALFTVFVALVALIILRGSVMLKALERSRADAQADRLRLASIVDSAGVGVVIMSGQNTLMTETNKDFQKMLGYTRDELTRMHYVDVVHPDEVKEADGLHVGLPNGARATTRRRFIRRDGEIVEAQITLTALDDQCRIGVIEDITQRLALQLQVASAHKLEAVGRLAGGIAHDFNNLLTAVSGHAELIRYTTERVEPAERDEIGESVEVILDAAGRAAALTRQLLTFSRLHEFSPQEIETAELIRRTEALLVRTIASDVQLVTTVAAGAPAVYVDPSQMDQVLLNLAVNASDAMPGGGTLNLTLGGWTRKGEQLPRYAGIELGDYCRISVSDTGIGMDAKTVERIFEPFFTTKEVGKGTGLGLATSHGIIAAAGGHLLCNSTLGTGTEFEIILPAFVATGQPPKPLLQDSRLPARAA